MSNKKKRNQKEESNSPELNFTKVSSQAKAIDETMSERTGKSANLINTFPAKIAGLFGYLKNHLWLVAVIAFFALGALGAGLKYLDDEARREIALRNSQKGKQNNQEQSFLNKVNPFLPAPMPSPTPLPLSKEYIYAGGNRLLAVEDAKANAAPPTDLAIWRPSNGEWWVMGANGGSQVTQTWGVNNDKPVLGDYDGDGKTDFAVWRPSNGTWYIINSAGGGGQVQFGLTGDIPTPADFDGDGMTDIAVYRPTGGVWHILPSSNSSYYAVQFGLSTDIPSPADYNGDGRADIAVWRNSDTRFYLSTGALTYETINLGVSSSQPVSGDYDGDGSANFAVKNGADWVIMNSSGSQTQTTNWGQATDLPVQNDYDGDGKVDIAVWRDSNGTWYIKNSSDNSTRTVQWGVSGDTPVPALYRR